MVVYGGWARTVWNVIAVGPPYCNDWSCPIPPYSNGAQNYISRGGYIDGGYTFTHDFDGGADNGKHYARSAWVAFRRAGMVSCSLGGHWGPPCDDCQCCATTGITQVTIDGVSVPYPGCPYTAPQQYTITVNTSPSGLDSPYGGGTYNQGTWITIGVNNVGGYTFKQWNRDGAVYTYSQSFSYQVDAPTRSQPYFSPPKHNITSAPTRIRATLEASISAANGTRTVNAHPSSLTVEATRSKPDPSQDTSSNPGRP